MQTATPTNRKYVLCEIVHTDWSLYSVLGYLSIRLI